MRSNSSNGGVRATPSTLAFKSGSFRNDDADTFTLASEKNPHEWFFIAAQRHLGKDAGYSLHLLTGYPVSSCYAYVAKDSCKRRRPPEHFLRKLFNTPEGEAFHAAFMQGSPWWIDIQHAAAFGRQVLSIKK